MITMTMVSKSMPDDLHATLIRDVLAARALTEQDAQNWMVVMTSQRIVLRADAPIQGTRTISGITWRSAAETISQLWRQKKHGAEHRYAEYIGPYNDYCEVSANLIEDVPEPRRSRVLELRDLLRTHPWVESVEDDD